LCETSGPNVTCAQFKTACHAQTMVVHKSRLEREKEAAAAASESSLEDSPGQDGSAGQARQRNSLPGSTFAGQVCQQCTLHRQIKHSDQSKSLLIEAQ